jgi:Tfp pilus assembly protein PilV
MIRTFFSRSKHAAQRAEGLARARMAGEEGDTLIEVVISVALISMVVIAVLFGLDSTNRATSASRARSQADVLAQEDEEQLRSEPVRRLGEIERSKEVKLGSTTYTIKTTSKYIADATSTASCTSSVAKADYLKTISTVTWSSMGPSGGVVETGVISPPADSALIVQVEESGTPLAGATVNAIGPAPSASKYELETSTNGCAVLALSPGEYTINASKTGYVDPNGYANTDSDPSVTQSVYLPAETTLKEGYNLGRAGNVKVKFSNASEPNQEGDSFVIYNTGMSSYRTFPEPSTVGTYKPTIESPTTVFPFTTNYTVYAGTCEADLPTRNGQSTNPEVLVPPGKVGEATVPLASINVKVLESKALEKPVQKALVTLEDTGCSAVRKLETTSAGTLSRPGMPFGTYSLCVSATVGGEKRRYTQAGIANNSASGTPVQTVYLGEAEKSSTGCP